MSRQKLDTRVRRDQIAEATLSLVAEHGLRRLSVAEVAQRVGIAPSALYRHYPGKEAVLDAVLERVRSRLNGIVLEAAAGPGDAVEALHRLLTLHLDLVRNHQAFFAVLVNDAFHSGAPERRRRVLGVITGYLDRVASIIRRGQRAREIRADVPARTLASLFLGIVQPTAMLWALSGGTFDIQRRGREAWPLLEQTLRGAPPRRTTRRGGRRGDTGDPT